MRKSRLHLLYNKSAQGLRGYSRLHRYSEAEEVEDYSGVDFSSFESLVESVREKVDSFSRGRYYSDEFDSYEQEILDEARTLLKESGISERDIQELEEKVLYQSHGFRRSFSYYRLTRYYSDVLGSLNKAKSLVSKLKDELNEAIEKKLSDAPDDPEKNIYTRLVINLSSLESIIDRAKKEAEAGAEMDAETAEALGRAVGTIAGFTTILTTMLVGIGILGATASAGILGLVAAFWLSTNFLSSIEEEPSFSPGSSLVGSVVGTIVGKIAWKVGTFIRGLKESLNRDKIEETLLGIRKKFGLFEGREGLAFADKLDKMLYEEINKLNEIPKNRSILPELSITIARIGELCASHKEYVKNKLGIDLRKLGQDIKDKMQ